LRDLVTDRSGPGLEGFAALDCLGEALAYGRKFDVWTPLRNQPMRQQAQCFNLDFLILKTEEAIRKRNRSNLIWMSQEYPYFIECFERLSP
jgi:hypothetical protein